MEFFGHISPGRFSDSYRCNDESPTQLLQYGKRKKLVKQSLIGELLDYYLHLRLNVQSIPKTNATKLYSNWILLKYRYYAESNVEFYSNAEIFPR